MKVCSIFSQVLKLFSRGEFEKAVKEHKAERHARGFTSWGHCYPGCDSLRPIEVHRIRKNNQDCHGCRKR